MLRQVTGHLPFFSPNMTYAKNRIRLWILMTNNSESNEDIMMRFFFWWGGGRGGGGGGQVTKFESHNNYTEQK